MKLRLAILVACISIGWGNDSVVAYEFGAECVARGSLDHLRSSGPLAALDLPIGRNRGRLIVQTGFTRQYDLAELDRFMLAASAGSGQFSFSLGISQLGKSDLFVEQLFKGSAQYHFRSLAVAVSASFIRQQFGGGYADLTSASGGAGLCWQDRKTVVSFMIDNLNSPHLIDHFKNRPLLRAQTSRELASGLTGSAGVLLQERESPRFLIGQAIDLSPLAQIGWQVETRPLVYGAAFRLVPERFLMQYTVFIHPVLGLTHAVRIGYGGRGVQ